MREKKLFELRQLPSLIEVASAEKVLRLSLFVDMIARQAFRGVKVVL